MESSPSLTPIGAKDVVSGARPGYWAPAILLIVWQTYAVAGQVIAVWMARHEYHRGFAEILSEISLAIAFGSALWVLIQPQLNRATRNTAVVCLGVTPTLMWRATNPLLFTGFDEQLHMRTLGDIISAHRLFEANPLLGISPHYPGLEATAVLVHQLGVPTMLAATAVVVAARLVLVTVLCDAVEQLTGSARAGGIAVAVYAVSPQFVFFNSQFSYQTLALPLALAAVSLTARSRRAADPLPFLGGATVCLVAVTLTHHLTSFITAAFLVLWVAFEKGQTRLRVAFSALAGVASVLAWGILQWSLLSSYLGPIFEEIGSQFSGGDRRKLFEDEAGTVTPPLDKFLLVYYAAALSLVVLILALLTLRWWRRGERQLLQWTPRLLVLMLSGSIPVLLAARVVPKGGQFFDRLSSFLFLALSFVVAAYAVRLWWHESPNSQPRQRHRKRGRGAAVQLLAVALVSVAFLGGHVLGSGPSWARLPGPYIPAADTRSMDAETLAAAKWARDALPAGSRIAAGRVSSTLLAAQAGLWPVMKGPGEIDVAALYVADDWALPETDMASSMRLRYLYVDLRQADEPPPFGGYFYGGETGDGKQLTHEQLAKFDQVPGIELIYRHGPVSIYDLRGLGLPLLRSGWYGSTPHVSIPSQLAVGLLSGLFMALVLRSRIWPRVMRSGAVLRRTWGPALTAAIVLAGVGLVSVAALLLGLWVTPLVVLSGALIVVLANCAAARSFVRRKVTEVPWRLVGTAALIAIPLAVLTAVAIGDAATEDIIKVRQILDSPAAIHISTNGP